MNKLSENLFEFTYKKNIPLSVLIELTKRCNLKCIHCYLDSSEVKTDKEMKTYQIKKILKVLSNSGCLYLVFTGGEIFLRDDLFEICEYAHKLKFDLRLFTNATLINEKNIKFLKETNTGGIEISIYGKEQTHDRITGINGSFRKVLNAILLLKQNKVPVTIKSPLMKLNYNDYEWLISFAESLNIKYKFDPIITPKNNGNKDILKYRLKEKQIFQLYQDKRLMLYKKTKKIFISTEDTFFDSLFCSAGKNFLSISSDGTVYPCLQLLLPLGNLLEDSFKKIWKNVWFRDLKPFNLIKCNSCSDSLYCRRCPGLALLEDGDLLGPSTIACKLTKLEKKFFD